MKKIASPKELFSRAWTAMKATWKTVLPLVAVIQLAAYVLSQLVSLVPGALGAILSFVVTAVIMVPTVGVLSGALGYLRGKPLTLDSMKAMFPHWQKVCMLYLWTMLCIMGWILVGVAVAGGGWLGSMLLNGDGAPIKFFYLMGCFFVLAGNILMLVLAFRAALDYSMSNCILIDDPTTPVRDILKKSKAMMHGYRWHYFKVGLPVFVGIMVIALVIGLLTAALPLWLNSLISTAMSVVTATMSQYLLPVMYEELKRIGR